METKPAFKGKPLIEVPFIPQIGFLEGDFGKAFLEEYQGKVNADYNGNSALNVLRYNGNTVTGSNPFAVVLANQILGQEGLRTATQADLEKVLKLGVLPLKGTYEDTGLVLRTEEDQDYSKNTPLAQDLGRQVKARKIKFSPKAPVMIPLTELEMQKAENGYGLTFKLKDDGKIYRVPVLSRDKSFSFTDETTGLPREASNEGNRNLYTRDSGLSGLYLVNNLNLDSNYGVLDNSFDDGRVVAVSAEGTSLDFDKYLVKLQKVRDEEVAEVQKRYEKAEAVLRGKK